MKLKHADDKNSIKFFNLKENEMEMYQCKREGSTPPAETSPQYWWQSLARDEAFELSHQKGYKFEVFKSIGMMCDPYELTRDAASVLIMFHMQKKKATEPCWNCKVSGGLGRSYPCHECILEGLDKADEWCKERRFAQLVENEGFEKRLTQFMEFLRVSLGSFRVFGQHLARAFVFYHSVEDIKVNYTALWKLRGESYFLNLVYSLAKFERSIKST